MQISFCSYVFKSLVALYVSGKTKYTLFDILFVNCQSALVSDMALLAPPLVYVNRCILLPDAGSSEAVTDSMIICTGSQGIMNECNVPVGGYILMQTFV